MNVLEQLSYARVEQELKQLIQRKNKPYFWEIGRKKHEVYVFVTPNKTWVSNK